MYCPRCATPHTDGAKFCRSCGAELESVALLLRGKSVQPSEDSKNKPGLQTTTQNWLEKRIESIKNITTGAILLSVSLLIGVALALFVPSGVPWILFWMVFFGWLAVWGGIALALGVGGMLEAKSRLRLMKLADKESSIDSTPQQLPPAGERPMITNSAASETPPYLSVTEGTTRQLND